MKWIEHGKNLEAETPKDCLFSFWISHISSESEGFGVSIYIAGGSRIYDCYCSTQEEGKQIVKNWLTNLQSQIDSLIK